ncbi:MAG TPA: sensor histidine kinase [Candidatus Sulfotelmatobacter sp.]|nr:sensor histidine kinase [Candidatus Sulfotelmatobacter sp.]
MPLIALDCEGNDRTASRLKLKPWRQFFGDKDHGWSPLLWVLYLGFFFVQPVLDHVSGRMWALDIAGALAFLVLYFGLFFLENPFAIAHIAGIILLGVLFQPINGGAATFFIFAAAMLPFCVATQRAAWIGLGVIGAIATIEGFWLHVPGWVRFYSALFPMLIGAGNTFFAERNRMNHRLRKANEEIEHLAKVAERERIARDLHDVLGHTLSVITLKSELAGKLIDRDPQRAGKEIREVEEISRQALAEVRDAIRGYRANGLVAELAHAKATLEIAGVSVQCEASSRLQLPATQESVLALAVREGVTNVLRHARASKCSLRLEEQNGLCQLEIADDGQGFVTSEGNGLRGMRERVEMLGGTLERRNKSGTTLTITLPLREAAVKEIGSSEVAHSRGRNE